jgi:CHASE3 domain sensor protein
MAQSSNAPDSGFFRGAHLGPPLPTGTLVAFLVAVLAIVLVASLSYGALEGSAGSARRVTHTLEVTEQLQALLSTLQDAETGQRGFLLTGHEDYLVPYTNAKAALAGEFKSAHRLIDGTPEQQRRLETLERVAAEKMEELEATVALRRTGDAAGALAIVRTNRGKEAMERARATIAEMQRDERTALAARQAEWLKAAGVSSVVVLGGSALLIILVGAAAMKTSRDYRARQTLAWVRAGQMGLNARIQGEQRLETLGDNVLRYLADYLQAQIGTVFISESGRYLRRIAAYAVPDGSADGDRAIWRGHPGTSREGKPCATRTRRSPRLPQRRFERWPVQTSRARSGTSDRADGCSLCGGRTRLLSPATAC